MSATWVEQIIQQYGLLAIFLVVALEYSCFPIPSELVLPFTGFIAATGFLPLPLVLPISVAAGLTGSFACYGLGRFGGERLLHWLLCRWPQTKPSLTASRNWFERAGGWSVLIGRCIPLVRTYISFLSGALRQSPGRFALASLLGIAVWNGALIILGYLLAENWSLITELSDRLQLLLFPLSGLGVASILAWFWWRRAVSRAE